MELKKYFMFFLDNSNNTCYTIAMYKGLTKAERLEAITLIDAGWTLHRNGWPDFLAEKDGKFRFIEVKDGYDRLSKSQKRMIGALFRLTGIATEIKHYETVPIIRKNKNLLQKRQAILLWARKYALQQKGS